MCIPFRLRCDLCFVFYVVLSEMQQALMQRFYPRCCLLLFFIQVAGKTFHFETGKMGRQAAGAVVARTGDTVVYSTVCIERKDKEVAVDFTPLRVDYFSRYSAAGQTIGAFHRKGQPGRR